LKAQSYKKIKNFRKKFCEFPPRVISQSLEKGCLLLLPCGVHFTNPFAKKGQIQQSKSFGFLRFHQQNNAKLYKCTLLEVTPTFMMYTLRSDVNFINMFTHRFYVSIHNNRYTRLHSLLYHQPFPFDTLCCVPKIPL